MGLNILVVDDSATMRAMLGRTLQMCGLPINKLHQAANGQEGLEVLGREWIDVVLVDINMPVMGGIEMIDRVRGNPELAELPIVVISTESSKTRIEEVHRKGVEFVHKPFTPEEVRGVLVGLLGEFDRENIGTDAF